jgi:hypothetical protein
MTGGGCPRARGIGLPSATNRPWPIGFMSGRQYPNVEILDNQLLAF